MAANWTREQKQVIENRDHALLVSAAAGAGKTAVLVEHILSVVCGDAAAGKGAAPTDIDRLLVVTFTKAAAAEMRERINQKLADRLEAEPDNVHLQRQTTLLHHAHICTIDSFCSYLLRNYFYEIDLDPAFRIADEGERKLMMQEIAAQLLEDCYEKGDAGFLAFADYFAAGRNDNGLENLILQLYEAAQSHPYPERWLTECMTAYEAVTPEAFAASPVGESFTQLVENLLCDCETLCAQAEALIAKPEGPAEYTKALAAERETVVQMRQTQDWTQWYALLYAKKTVSMRKSKAAKSETGQALADRTEALIRRVREMLSDLKKKYFAVTPQKMTEGLAVCREPVKELIALVRLFAGRFDAHKREKNILDFSDIEHLALRVLRDENGMPTETATRFRHYFAEIMIDEYQDSNLLQEYILTAIAEANGANLFMVGDVKQSIYQFRQAHPELFTEKLERYLPYEAYMQMNADDGMDTKQSPAPLCISLHKNFRSRREVIDSVNAVFAALMHKYAGGVTYDASARLHYGAAYAQGSGYRTEVLSIDEETLPDKNMRQDVITAEAQLVVKRILELTDPVSGLLVGEDKERRVARYGDIVILLRSRGQWAESFVNTLMENGIPAYAQSTAGFYATQEIQTILQYLALLDNKRQDLPMTAALTSPIGGFTADELAQIRLAFPDMQFHEAVGAYARYGTNGALRLRLVHFLNQLEAFRVRTPYTRIHALLQQIYEETGYYAFASSMPGGQLRRANLDMLMSQALSFEQTSYRGLFHFLRYIEQMQKYDLDIGEASALLESVDAVRIMTVHKSKGLEFPIVFLSGLGKQFNDQDERQQVIISGRGGIGVDEVDVKLRTKRASAVKVLLQRQNHADSRAEEIRVLYVAMTRAREKLILTVVHKKEQGVVRCASHPILYQNILGAKCMWDWLREIVGTDAAVFDCAAFDGAKLAEEESLTEAEEACSDAEAVSGASQEEKYREEAQALLVRMNYVYPYGGRAHAAKVSVSELKRQAMQEADDAIVTDRLYEEPAPVPLLPRFAAPTAENTAAARGTAYHKVLQHIDYRKALQEADVRQLLAMLVGKGLMSAQDAGAVVPAQITAFLQSDIGQRMKRAAYAGTLRREQPFVFGVPASEVYNDASDEEQVLIQGIVDAYFEEDGQLVLVDYKTDRVGPADGAKKLLEKYRMQVSYYARALSQLLELPVKSAYLYSFALGEAIEYLL